MPTVKASSHLEGNLAPLAIRCSEEPPEVHRCFEIEAFQDELGQKPRIAWLIQTLKRQAIRQTRCIDKRLDVVRTCIVRVVAHFGLADHLT